MAELKTNEKILEAAVRIFAQKGYNAASTKEIAQEAGVAEGTIFRYYKTKKDILLTALDTVVDKFSDDKALRPIEKIINDHESNSPETVLKEIIRDRIAIFRENSELIKIIFTEAQYSAEISKKFYYAMMTKVLPVLLDFVSRGVRDGRFKDLGRDGNMVLLRCFISMTIGFIFQRNYAPNFVSASEEEDIDMMVEIFLSGIRVI